MTKDLTAMERGMLRALERRSDGSPRSKEEQQRALERLARVLDPGERQRMLDRLAPLLEPAVVEGLYFAARMGVAEARDTEARILSNRNKKSARFKRGKRKESPEKPIALQIGNGIMKDRTRGLYLSNLAGQIAEAWRDEQPCPRPATLRGWIVEWKADGALPNSDLIWVQSRKKLAT